MHTTPMPAGDVSLRLWEVARWRMIGRLRHTIVTPLDGFPDHADVATRRRITKADGGCTGGFFAGWLWLAAREHPELKVVARKWAYALRSRVRSKTH